jgi:hypothetical protein
VGPTGSSPPHPSWDTGIWDEPGKVRSNLRSRLTAIISSWTRARCRRGARWPKQQRSSSRPNSTRSSSVLLSVCQDHHHLETQCGSDIPLTDGELGTRRITIQGIMDLSRGIVRSRASTPEEHPLCMGISCTLPMRCLWCVSPCH